MSEEAGREAARRVFATFHQEAPDRTLELDIPAIPKDMVLVAQCEEITYSIPDGVPSGRAGVAWTHRFGDEGEGRDTHVKPLILANPDHEGILVLVTPPGRKRFRLRKEGIVG